MKKRPTDPSETAANPSAPARRRLLRALGGKGAAALAVVSSPQWTRPVVEVVVLPAHAQTTAVEAPEPVGCTVAMSVEFFPGPSQTAYSLSAMVDDTVLDSTTGGSESASLFGSSTFPPGGYVASVLISQAVSDVMDVAATASCCDAIQELNGSGTVTSFTVPFPLQITEGDDAECSFAF